MPWYLLQDKRSTGKRGRHLLRTMTLAGHIHSSMGRYRCLQTKISLWFPGQGNLHYLFMCMQPTVCINNFCRVSATYPNTHTHISQHCYMLQLLQYNQGLKSRNNLVPDVVEATGVHNNTALYRNINYLQQNRLHTFYQAYLPNYRKNLCKKLFVKKHKQILFFQQ